MTAMHEILVLNPDAAKHLSVAQLLDWETEAIKDCSVATPTFVRSHARYRNVVRGLTHENALFGVYATD